MSEFFHDTKFRIPLFVILIMGSFFVLKPFGIFQSATVLLAPNSGETFAHGQKIDFRWVSGSPGIRLIELAPTSGGVAITVYQAAPFGYPMGDAGGYFPFDPVSSPWLTVPDGSYYVRIYPANSYSYTQSSAPIRIGSSGVQTNPPSTIAPPPASSPAVPVHVISPNGGESFTLGGSIRISWSGGKNKVWVGIAQSDYRQGTTDPLMGWITKDGVSDSSLTWDGNLCVTSDYCRPVTYWQPSGAVRVVVVSGNDNGDICTWSDRPCNLDASDAPFIVYPRPPLPLPMPSLAAKPVTPPPPSATIPSPTIKPTIKPNPVSPPGKSKTDGTPTVTVLAPNGQENFRAGSPMEIRWAVQNAPPNMLVSITLFSKNPAENRDYVWAANVVYKGENDGMETWSIPGSIPDGSSYYIRIACDYPQGSPYVGCKPDDSDAAFSILNNSAVPDGQVQPGPATSGKKGFFGRIFGGITGFFGSLFGKGQ